MSDEKWIFNPEAWAVGRWWAYGFKIRCVKLSKDLAILARKPGEVVEPVRIIESDS